MLKQIDGFKQIDSSKKIDARDAIKIIQRLFGKHTSHQSNPARSVSHIPLGRDHESKLGDDDNYLNKSNLDAATELVANYEIKSIHILCLGGFIRKYFNIEAIPIDIIHLLLFYYAKPLTFHCQWDSTQTNAKSGDIIYCAVCDNWDSLLIKIANMDKQKFQKIPNILSYHSKSEQNQTVTNTYGKYGFNQVVNLFEDDQQLICSRFSHKYAQSPNIEKMIRAISQCKWTSKALNIEADLLELFQIYLDAEQLDDDGIEDEFGDDACLDECFFIEWLRDENNERLGTSISDEDQLTKIWKYLSSVARIHCV